MSDKDPSWHNGDRGFLKWVQGYLLDEHKHEESQRVQDLIERIDALVEDLDSYAKTLEYISNIGSQLEDPKQPLDAPSRLTRAVTVASRTLKVRSFDDNKKPVFVSITRRGEG